MIKKFYHGAPLKESESIIYCGYINAGCICDDKKFASKYAHGDGYIFTVYQNWHMAEIVKLKIERFLLSLFLYSDKVSGWLYDKGIIPHNCTEYINEPWEKNRTERRFKVKKYERTIKA